MLRASDRYAECRSDDAAFLVIRFRAEERQRRQSGAPQCSAHLVDVVEDTYHWRTVDVGRRILTRFAARLSQLPASGTP